MTGPTAIVAAVVDGWNRFWFEPVPTSTLAVYRIVLGVIVFAWTATLVPDLMALFGSDGVVARQPDIEYAVGVFTHTSSDAVVVAVTVVLLGAAGCVVVGWHTRVASALMFVGVLSLQQRNPLIHNSGDVLILLCTFYLALAPAGAALSLDRRRTAPDAPHEFPARAPWALRLVQIQICIVYATGVWAKVRGVTWNNGTASSYALRIEDLERFPVPAFAWDNLVFVNLVTYATLALEVLLPILVWNRRARPWVLGAGVALHLSIHYSLLVGFFSLTMLACYVAFVPPETMSALVRRWRDRNAATAPSAGVVPS